MHIHSLYSTYRTKHAHSNCLCRATSLPSVRQHCLRNAGSSSMTSNALLTSSAVKTLHPTNTGVPCVLLVSVHMPQGRGILRPCLFAVPANLVLHPPLIRLCSFVALSAKQLLNEIMNVGGKV